MRIVLLSLVFVLALAAPLGRVRAAPPAPGFATNAKRLLESDFKSGKFRGVVLVAHEGKPILRVALGDANREWRVPVSSGTVFRIGSTTKQFTAAAILQLAEEGKLEIDDPISKYYDTPPSWSGITLRQLLTHTSGIPDFTQTNGFIRGGARLEGAPETFLRIIRDQPLDFAPGSKFRYDNTGYVLLGLVIEKVSGETYPQYLEDRIFRPLGMSHTAYDRLDEIVPDRASGYWLTDGGWRNARLWTTAASFAAGGVRSTADDLLRWDQALYGAKPLNPQSIGAMFTDYGHGYGFGSFVELRHGHRLWDHGGNLPGFSSAFERYPDDKLTIIVLSNIEGQQSEQISKALAGLYFGWKPGT